MLSARGLFCERDDRILFSALDFDLGSGEILQIQGSNGSGKTTLLRMLCGLNDNFEGQINWYGESISRQRERFYNSLLYLGHRVGVNKVLSPVENLRWSCALQSTISEQRIMQALQQLGLRGFEDSPCNTLSAGQQQRVSLARLLLSPARLWILDEPFTTLDVHGVADLEQMLGKHVVSGGSALVTTHHALNISSNIRYLNLDEVEHG